jgi:GLPGLI family protein
MKKNFFVLSLAIIICTIAAAQDNNSGTVKYEQVVKLEIKVEGDAAQFASMLPKERKMNKVLSFNSKSSLYENGKAPEQDNLHMQSGGQNVMIRMEEPKNILFTDIESKKTVELREFMTRVFLIEGEANTQWKMTGNQKMILNYPCMEAFNEKDSIKTTAWFTPAIPVSAGPGNYSGLPGLVLAVDTNNGKNVITATSVEIAPVADDKLVKPDKGKKVTQEEFDAVVKEKMKEMGAESGVKGGTQMMIKFHQ